MIDLKSLSILDMLPDNLKRDPNIAAAAKALDSSLQGLSEQIMKLPRFQRLDQLNDDEADELAWQFHVDFYDPDLPIEQKRELVKNAFLFHRRKGTPAAVEELIEILFGTGQVEEWFEYGGEPGYFRVRTTDQSATNERAQEFIRAVDSVRRLSAHLESVILEETIQANDLYFGGTLHIGEFITIG
ncbi:phage tail protein I [Paenibacillus brevis]|uniref:Phage tail protein I n=1 Tax=Paenibacillus brevis TaxID=2841508 RepID=A0ABS6FQZ1_9BACL|nr:phage tail protein I [Paenibacillus brevis]MBU5672654.1 phage tail protein I [Paenibacillus brevis]